MTWTPISFTPPASLQAVANGLQGCRDAAPGEMDNSKDRLESVKGAVTISTNPVAPASSEAAALRASMEELLQVGGRFVCVHPYIHPMGDRRGDYAYLTPQQGVEGIAAKLADQKDRVANAQQAVFLLLRGVDNKGFVDTLAAFNAVFSVTDLQLAERRARWLDSLERDKLIQETGPIHPAWTGQDARRHPGGSAIDRSMGGLLGMAEGYAQENTRPEDELVAVIERKRAHLQKLDAAWAAITDALQGGKGKGLVLEGNLGGIHRQLKENMPPVEGYKLTAVCCWIGSTDATTFFKELLGI